MVEAGGEHRSVGVGPRAVLLEDAFAAGRPEGVELAVEDLASLDGGDAGVADEAHGLSCTRLGGRLRSNDYTNQPQGFHIVVVVSVRGGGADRIRQRTWPPQLLYTNGRHEFGRRMVRDFEGAGLRDVLEDSTVATNITFPQARGFDEWLRKPGSGDWLERSLAWVEELILLMLPQVILTYGRFPFRYLVGRWRNDRIELTEWRGVPLVCCGHLIQGATRVARLEAMKGNYILDYKTQPT